MKKKIYFVRHGESTANVSGVRHEGTPKLTQKGEEQAGLVAEHLKTISPEIILASPMKRATQTAYQISELTQAPVKTVEQLKERAYPAFLLGVSKHQPTAKEYFRVYKKLWGQVDEISAGGENLDEFLARVRQTLSMIETLPQSRVVAVSHAFFIKATVAWILFQNKTHAEHIFALYDNFKLDNTGIVELEFDSHSGWKLITWNQKTHLNQNQSAPKPSYKKKVVTIGGGTGQYTLLSGLKNKNLDLTAIVSMADSGGTTGVLRDELGVLPPTDVRKCIVALSEAEPVLRELFMYRFANENLKGHTVGNLILTALEKITGNFAEAVELSSKIFKTKGRVLPVSSKPMTLMIKLNNGQILEGEECLDDNEYVREYGIQQIYLKEPVKINPKAKQAILEADMVVIGPGDLYGSIMPNLLAEGMVDALVETQAKIVFISNLTNKKGQTLNFSACDYVEKIHEYAGEEFINTLVCNKQKPDKELLARYIEQEGEGVWVECAWPCGNVEILMENLLSNEEFIPQKGDTLAHTRSLIRHDSETVAQIIEKILHLLNNY